MMSMKIYCDRKAAEVLCGWKIYIDSAHQFKLFLFELHAVKANY